MIEITAVPGKVLMLGRQGENLARKVIFSVSGVRAEFGDGTFRLSAKRPGESDAYPATITETGGTVVWALTGADTQNAGHGQCELAYYAGEARFKTWTYDTAIAKSLTGSPKTDPYDEFLDEVNRLAAEAAISQREAKNSENAAKNSEENAKASEGAAKTSEDNAAEHARAALASEKKSEQNAENAASAAVSAGQYAQNAAVSATNAANSASAAENHEKGAKDAATAAAKSAEGLADAVKRAEDAATSAQDNAAKTAADREAVAEMKTAAETAKGDAEKSATAAAGSATAAETSRTGAAEIKTQIDEIKAGIDQAKADIDQTKTDTLAAKDAAETAATTATEKAAEIADSAAQIATNTTNIETNATDIDRLRRENTELRAKTDALWKLSEGKSYDFVEDATEAYSKDVPSGCRFAEVERIGGKTVARNAGELVSAGVKDVEVGFPEQSGSMVTISDGIDGHALDVTASWTPTQAGSGDPSPENIRPISGRDKITLTRCGRNLWSYGDLTITSMKEIALNYPAGRYVFAANLDTDAKTTVQIGVLVDGIWKYFQNAPAKPVAIKITATKSFGGVRLYAGSSPSEQATTAYRNVAVWAGLIAPAAYEPYSGESTTLSPPETIDGGSVDQDGNGVKEWALLTLDGTESWQIGGIASDKSDWFYQSPRITDAVNTSPSQSSQLCSHYPYSAIANNNTLTGCAVVWGQIRVRWGDTIPENTDAWKSYLAAQKAAGTPVTIAYKLASPTTFTAAGAKTITAKSGVNNITSNADSITVKYAEDTYPIPDAVKALPGYGWSAGNVRNEIVRRADGWDYVQRVGLPATTDGYTALAAPITTDITDLMTGALPLMATEPGGMITMHHALADDGLTLDVPNTVKYIRDLKEVASSGTE